MKRFLRFLAVFLILSAIIIIAKQVKEYSEGVSVYDELASEVTSTEDSKSKDKKDKVFTVDWEKLKGTDCVAWVRFKNPKQISYPVMQGENNSYYLHHLYNGKYNFAGSIFLNSGNDGYFRDENSIIYGHNMSNRSMFGNLRKFKDQSFVDENQYFYIYLPDGTRHTYQIFSVVNAKDGSSDYSYGFKDLEEYQDYQKRLKSKSIVDTAAKIDANKRMVSLSTCASIGSAKGKRVMVTGIEVKVVKVQDAASWYKEPTDTLPTVWQGEFDE